MRRELVAAVAVPLVVAAIVWLPAWIFLILLGAVVLAAGDELLGMARGRDLPAGRIVPLICLAALLAVAWAGTVGWLLALTVATLILLPTLQLAAPERPRGALAGAAVATFAVLFLGLTGACLGWLRAWPEGDGGIRLILVYLFTVWAGDSGAYYIGKRFGRHKMSPRISPNKTWEGLSGGVVTTFIAAAVAAWIAGLDLGWVHLAAVAAILAVAAPVGDLLESAFKRDTGVKDSSGLLPGHGGLLDRTDSLLYPAPLVLGYLVIAGLLR